MALRRISQLDPVLHSEKDFPETPSEELSIKLQEPSTLDEQVRWFVKNNPLLSGYLMEVSEWNGISANAPSYYLSKQFDLSSLITIISASITGALDDMSLFTNWHRDYNAETKQTTETELSVSLHEDNIMYRNTYHHGENIFENNVKFHRNVILEGDRLYHEALTSALITTGKKSRTEPTLCVNIPSIFLYPINACAMSAWWADLAEVYNADGWYAPGTLVQFGGDCEVTIATSEANAVVTTSPGFILNTGSHPQYKCPVGLALTGRTPVLVSGKIKKFDKIVLDPNNIGIGCAMTDDIKDKTPIAVALESNDDPDVKLVMCSTKFTF